MRDYYVFDIPIYRCTQEKYYQQLEAETEKQTDQCCEAQGLARALCPSTVEGIQQHTFDRFGGLWAFNQVIGWLRLFVEGRGIGGHLWMAKGRQFRRRMPGKTFRLTTPSNVLATYLPPNCTSAEVYKHVLSHIEDFAKRDSFRRRFVDLSVFSRIGPHVDWLGLMKAGMSHAANRYQLAQKREQSNPQSEQET